MILVLEVHSEEGVAKTNWNLIWSNTIKIEIQFSNLVEP